MLIRKLDDVLREYYRRFGGHRFLLADRTVASDADAYDDDSIAPRLSRAAIPSRKPFTCGYEEKLYESFQSGRFAGNLQSHVRKCVKCQRFLAQAEAALQDVDRGELKFDAATNEELSKMLNKVRKEISKLLDSE